MLENKKIVAIKELNFLKHFLKLIFIYFGGITTTRNLHIKARNVFSSQNTLLFIFTVNVYNCNILLSLFSAIMRLFFLIWRRLATLLYSNVAFIVDQIFNVSLTTWGRPSQRKLWNKRGWGAELDSIEVLCTF